MLIVHVMIQVKPDRLAAFKAATLDNAHSSLREPGIARFDVIQQVDDPTHVVLVEAYRNPEAVGQHKQTAHYAAWRDAVADMLVEPRTRVEYTNTFPDDTGWDLPLGHGR